MGLLPNPVEQLREWWGQRSSHRRARGTSALSRAALVVKRLEVFFAKEAEEFGRFLDPQGGGPAWAVEGQRDARDMADGFRQAYEQLMEGNASLDGWDTMVTNQALEAVSPKGLRAPEPNGKGGSA